MIFFYVVPALVFLEIAAFIAVGSHLGVFATLLLCFLSAVLGTAIVQHQGLGVLGRVRQSLDKGLLPMDDMFDGLCLMIAGILLILPGFVSDIIGFALLVPAVRQQLRRVLAAKYGHQEGSLNPDTGVIEGDFIRVRDDPDRLSRPANDR